MIPAHTPPHNMQELINSLLLLAKNKNTKDIFENIIKDLLQTENFITLSSGRRALYLGLKNLGIKKGDEIILPAFATNIVPIVIREVGATPIPADANIDDYNICAESVLERVSYKTKAILAIHTFGYPSQLKALQDVCDDKNLFLIEDAAQAFGAKLDGKYVGVFGDIGIISFGIGKSISLCNGGMLISKKQETKFLESKLPFKRAASSINTCFIVFGSIILSHPFLYKIIGRQIKDMRVSHQYDHFKYELMDEKDMSALSYAIGILQLTRNVLNIRRDNAFYYNKYLRNFEDIYLPLECTNICSAYTRYFVRVESEAKKNAIAKRMKSKGVEVLVPDQGYPISKALFPKRFLEGMPIAKRLSKTLIAVPINTRLKHSTLWEIFQ